MEKARKKFQFLTSLYYFITLYFELEPVKLIIKFNVQISKFKVHYTSVATISSRVPGNMSMTGISGMV